MGQSLKKAEIYCDCQAITLEDPITRRHLQVPLQPVRDDDER